MLRFCALGSQNIFKNHYNRVSKVPGKLEEVMKQRRWMGSCALLLALSIGVAACQVGEPLTTGGLRFQFQTASKAVSFQIQAIPAATERFEIEVAGEGLSEPILQTVSLGAGLSSQTHTISALPVGSKTVYVKALGAAGLLAEARVIVMIEAGQMARAELDLVPVSAAQVRLRLLDTVPLDLSLDLTFQGAGLNEALRHQVTLPQGKQEAPLPDLPAGEKQVSMIFRAELNGRSFASPAQTETLQISAEGQGLLEISAENLLNAFGNELDQLLDGITPAQLLALIAQLGEARLRSIFSQLPPAVRLRILQNAKLSGFTQFLPAPQASAAPSAAPTARPAPEDSASPVSASELFADVRLALVELANPQAVLLAAPQDEPGRLRILKPGESHFLFRTAAWALLIRTHYTGQSFISYGTELKRLSNGEVIWRSNGELRSTLELNGESFISDAVYFRPNRSVLSLEPGQYELTLRAQNPSTQIPETLIYRLEVPAPFAN